MKISLPQQCLVLLIGPTGCGKSTFAQAHFLPTEVVSSDRCRALVSDDEGNQAATEDAFELLRSTVSIRLRRGRLTVVDATNLRREDRDQLRRLAKEQDTLCAAIVFETPQSLCHERNQERPDRNFGPEVVRRHFGLLRNTLRSLKREKFHRLYRVTPEAKVTVERVPLWNDRRELTGPFDIIGDLHGCADELEELLQRLGYGPEGHSQGRLAIFVGDLVDRGPRVLDCVDRVRDMVEAGQALCVAGNHDVKAAKFLRGRKVRIAHGLEQTATELEEKDESYKEGMADFLEGLISHYLLDQGRLVVAHAGIKEAYIGRASNRVRHFCLYGETTGEVDEFGLPVRHNWAADYRGQTTVVYGHTPVPEAVWLNRTLNLDTGCVFGGKLTALRYPEMELVQVPAARVYSEPVRPLSGGPQRHQTHLKLGDVAGKQLVSTRLRPNITIPAENSAAALELISRFAVAPECLIYLPPTMSPCATSQRADYLEYPQEAFEFYAGQGVRKVICEEKHMGSRAVLVLKRDASGRIYTRTGRPFLNDELELRLVEQLAQALETAGFWDDFGTDWVCLDAELMPWSAKAQALLREQYAAVGAASTAALNAALDSLPEGEVKERFQERRSCAGAFTQAYGHYCWPTEGLEGLKLAPFHLLATRGKVYSDQKHQWHLETLKRYLGGAPCFYPTDYRVVDLEDADQVRQACLWWEELTAAGGEGAVIKPNRFLQQGPKGLVQPALKVRGREYLRIIYGPEYTRYLPQLRKRGLGRKRSLALREFCLGLDALERYVAGEPLYAVHQRVFGVLALESSPVDPRL